MAFKINQIQFDEVGRPSAILAINKPSGLTSHDVVDRVRNILHTKKVGHAGALDPFATGVLVILVGKATKLSDRFLQSDKEYVCKILFGVQTDSADTEGKVIQVNYQLSTKNLANKLKTVLPQFSPSYDQFVPVYSSVKIKGEKLRSLARKADSHQIFEQNGTKFVQFMFGDRHQKLELPKRKCQVPEIELLGISNYQLYMDGAEGDFPTADVRVKCSKGTYVRALAEDIGAELSPPVAAMLVELERTVVGKISIQHSITLEQLKSLVPPLPESTPTI